MNKSCFYFILFRLLVTKQRGKMSSCLDFFCQHMICMYAIIILRVRVGSLLGHRVDDQVLVPICCGGAHLAIDFLLIIRC